MKVAILGGSGFVGTRLIDILKDEYEIVNIDLVNSPFFPDLTQIGDVRVPSQMNEMLKGTDIVVLLAAQHRDDVTPTSLYYDTNVGGMKTVLDAMETNGIKRLVFFSSLAVYGLDKDKPSEESPADPFNHYGKSKWEAEQVLQQWLSSHSDVAVTIMRPTVIFGERNRGNVYNLLNQIAKGRFMMVGDGKNHKSMAYVGNVVTFVKYIMEKDKEGCQIYNYSDGPDFDMNSLVSLTEEVLGKKIPTIHLPYGLGMLGGYCFDALAWITRKKLNISSVRIKKFCANTETNSTKAHSTGFIPPFTLQEGLSRTLLFEFVHPQPDNITFHTE
ncbi:MAG: NAD-dependent epimerase/dehydratase family protein [Bacteroidaceae bacterium]|nr:NAD-dependent epimerase/dehydratase family protein [Bacteroidaceae bacterium]